MESNKPQAVIYGDGSCLGNPGRGGWGVIVCSPDGIVHETGGYEPQTTNNRMELMAVIEGLRQLVRMMTISGLKARPVLVQVHSDSHYVLKGMTEWMRGWKQKHWIKNNGELVSNHDLWLILDRAAEFFTNDVAASLIWKYVPGHKGIPGNERVDLIAQQFARHQGPGGLALFKGPAAGYGVRL